MEKSSHAPADPSSDQAPTSENVAAVHEAASAHGGDSIGDTDSQHSSKKMHRRASNSRPATSPKRQEPSFENALTPMGVRETKDIEESGLECTDSSHLDAWNRETTWDNVHEQLERLANGPEGDSSCSLELVRVPKYVLVLCLLLISYLIFIVFYAIVFSGIISANWQQTLFLYAYLLLFFLCLAKFTWEYIGIATAIQWYSWDLSYRLDRLLRKQGGEQIGQQDMEREGQQDRLLREPRGQQIGRQDIEREGQPDRLLRDIDELVQNTPFGFARALALQASAYRSSLCS
jgi:hypothetical protein